MLISAAVIFDYSDFSLLTNFESYVIASVALLLFFLSAFLKPVKNIKTANFILNALIIFLFIFIVINIMIIIDPNIAVRNDPINFHAHFPDRNLFRQLFHVFIILYLSVSQAYEILLLNAKKVKFSCSCSRQ